MDHLEWQVSASLVILLLFGVLMSFISIIWKLATLENMLLEFDMKLTKIKKTEPRTYSNEPSLTGQNSLIDTKHASSIEQRDLSTEQSMESLDSLSDQIIVLIASEMGLDDRFLNSYFKEKKECDKRVHLMGQDPNYKRQFTRPARQVTSSSEGVMSDDPQMLNKNMVDKSSAKTLLSKVPTENIETSGELISDSNDDSLKNTENKHIPNIANEASEIGNLIKVSTGNQDVTFDLVNETISIDKDLNSLSIQDKDDKCSSENEYVQNDRGLPLSEDVKQCEGTLSIEPGESENVKEENNTLENKTAENINTNDDDILSIENTTEKTEIVQIKSGESESKDTK